MGSHSTIRRKPSNSEANLQQLVDNEPLPGFPSAAKSNSNLAQDSEELRGEMRTLAMQGLTQAAFRKSTTEVYDNFTKTSKQTNTCYDNLAEADYILNEAVHSAQIRTASKTTTSETETTQTSSTTTTTQQQQFHF